MKILTARCLCEAIAYEINGELGPIYNCHCSKCRRWHGAAFRTRASIKKNQFKWIKGEELLSKYNSSENATKTFCSICGSCLITTYKNFPEVIGIPLGGLEQDPGGRPIANIFMDSKAPWYNPCDGLAEYATWPDSEEKVRETNK